MDKKIILSLLIVALIGIVAATYQINNGVDNLNPLSNVAVEDNPVTQTLAAPEHSNDGAQAPTQEQQQEQQKQQQEQQKQQQEQQKQQQEQQKQQQEQQKTAEQNNAAQDAQNNEATAQQTAPTTNSQPQTASTDSEHVEGTNGNNGDNQGQNNPQTTVTVNDNPSTNDGTNDNSRSNNNGGNNNQGSNSNPTSTDNNAVVPDYSQNEGNSAQLDNDGEVLDSGIDASIISSSEVFSKLESFVQTRWTQTETVHLDNAQEYTSDSGERYYRYDIVRDSDNSVVGQASFNRRTGKVTMMDNSGPTN